MASVTSTLTLRLLDDVSKPARTVAMALKDAEAQIKAVARGMAASGATDKFVASLGRLKLGAKDIESVSAAWKDYSKSASLAADSTKWTREQTSAVRNWESTTIRALRAVKAEEAAYSRSLKSAAPQQPAAAARGAGGAGSLVPFLGPAVLKIVADGLKGASAIQAQDIANKVAAIPRAEAVAADRQAIALSAKYSNLGVGDVIQLYRELRSVLPNTAEVPGMMDAAARAKSVMEAGGLDTSGLIYALKSAELLGDAKDKSKLSAFLNAFVKAQQVEGKTITPEGLFDFAQQLKAAAPNLSASFVNSLGPLLAQEMTGGRAGTSIQQFEKQIQGGFQGQLHAAAKEFVAIGLAKTSDFETTKTGEIKGMKRGHEITGADLADTDPDKWVYTVLVPALAKAGFDTQAKMIKELPRLFPNQNAANLVAKLIQQQDQWGPKMDRINAAQGLDAGQDQLQGAGVAFGALKTQLGDLVSVLDSPAMKDIGVGLSAFATGVGAAKVGLDKFEQAFPAAARGLAGLGVAASAAAGGFLTLKLFTGFTGGFGLKTSAVALDESAAALSAAAARLGGASVVGGASGAKGGAKSKGGVFWPLLSLFAADGAANAADDAGIPGWIDKNIPGASWLDNLASKIGLGLAYRDQGLPPSLPDRAAIVAAKPLDDVALRLARKDYGDRRDVFHDNLERARENSRAGALSSLKPRVDDARSSLDALNATVAPQVDTSSLERASALAQTLFAELGRIGALAGALPGTIGRASPPPLGRTLRGGFTTQGVQGQ